MWRLLSMGDCRRRLDGCQLLQLLERPDGAGDLHVVDADVGDARVLVGSRYGWVGVAETGVASPRRRVGNQQGVAGIRLDAALLNAALCPDAPRGRDGRWHPDGSIGVTVNQAMRVRSAWRGMLHAVANEDLTMAELFACGWLRTLGHACRGSTAHRCHEGLPTIRTHCTADTMTTRALCLSGMRSSKWPTRNWARDRTRRKCNTIRWHAIKVKLKSQ